MVDDRLRSIVVGVLQGGISSEREISFQSGRQVIDSLERSGIKAKGIDVATSDRQAIADLIGGSGIDLAFIALHGAFGEDGGIQRMLEALDIPYTGSGPEASLKAMDKAVAKEIFLKEGIPTPVYEVIIEGMIPDKNRSYPLVVKPHLSGSSVGISIVQDGQGLKTALEKAFRESEKALVEEYIPGIECTVGILDGRPLGVVEIRPKTLYYDFSAKYTDGMVEFISPARITEPVYQLIRDTGLRAHTALGCRDFSRVDIRLSREGVPYVLEVNSIPGLTSHSLLPLSAACMGIDFDSLIKTMIELSLRNREVTKERN